MENKERKKYISYLRISTNGKKQKYSIESQREIVKNYVGENEIVKEFVEYSSGANAEREVLKEAILYSKQHNCTIVISRLDRISRSILHLVRLLEEEKVDFVTCDGIIDAFSLHIHIALAQRELELIRDRIRKGLRQAKLKGKTLGTPSNLQDEHRAKGRKKMIERAFEKNKVAGQLIVLLRKQGKPYAKIADFLNENGYTTRRNKAFASSTVQMLYKRYKDNV
jgi:DNA invertase Pin-like site-specific DNA recombinase